MTLREFAALFKSLTEKEAELTKAARRTMRQRIVEFLNYQDDSANYFACLRGIRTQSQIADIAKVPQGFISKLEAGKLVLGEGPPVIRILETYIELEDAFNELDI